MSDAVTSPATDDPRPLRAPTRTPEFEARLRQRYKAEKRFKYAGLGAGDAVLTVATDGTEMYGTELDRTQRAVGPLDELAAAEIYGRYMLGAATDHTLELDRLGRERVFNLGYYTWVEQQGVSLDDFDARRDQSFWDSLMDLVPIWDQMINTFNG